MKDQNSKKQDNGNTVKHEAEIAYGFLLQLRNVDLNLLWTRSGFFFAINGALLGFMIRNLDRDFMIHPGVIGFFGVVIVAIWWKVTELGCSWLDSWERQLKNVEDKVFPSSPDLCIFRANEYRRKIKGGSIKKILIRVTVLNMIVWDALLLYVPLKQLYQLYYF